MSEMMHTIAATPRAVLTSDARVFGFSYAELLFVGMIFVGLATGPWADVTSLSELLHFHNIVSAISTIGACAVSFATGRMSAKDKP
jgi:hypothetical protein